MFEDGPRERLSPKASPRRYSTTELVHESASTVFVFLYRRSKNFYLVQEITDLSRADLSGFCPRDDPENSAVLSWRDAGKVENSKHHRFSVLQ
jgi:hypothetical protein